MSASPSLCWFRLDLRLDDNPALRAAAAYGAPVIPIFIWSPEEEEAPWPPGAASRWWLHQSLLALQKNLHDVGSKLIIRRGHTAETLQAIAKETGAENVFWNRRYEPAVRQHDARVEKSLTAAGLAVQTFLGHLLFDPEKVRTATGKPFQVFTPFFKACLAQPEPELCHSGPTKLAAPKKWPKSLPLDNLKLEPTIDWATGIAAAWIPGATGAQATLKKFAHEHWRKYSTARDRPDEPGTSRLSPYLHFGELSPRRAWHTILHAAGGKPGKPIPRSAEPFLRQLVWREFAHYLLYHYPQTDLVPLHEQFSKFPWRKDPKVLHSWQRGQTGYPLVDAGMRQLWTTGWMHNRVRMVVASFLIKHLLITCVDGAKWFWDTLVDADLANNTMGWQWVAGCGADAAPFFRIFNPVLQGEKFDPQGEYVRRWVPELAKLPAQWIHQPWEASPQILAKAGVTLGKDYPHPIVDHAAARARALEALKKVLASH